VTISDPCVSISAGTLSPDQRVNYAYGMVLGLDEFLTEQQYFLNKDYLHERALHGYGTVYGLQVTVSPAGTSDFTIQVAPGMAIDQWGREVVVRAAQCARLGSWLAAQDQETVAHHMGPSAEFTVYVVANYADCQDDLVPLPGQPCSSSAQTMVASRLRDAWNIQLRWEPPPMLSWDTDRRLARLLSSVQIVAGLDPAQSSEAEIIAAVLALPSDLGAGPEDLWPLVDWPPGSPPSGPSGPVVYKLPAETAADALDRIFTIWVTQVRPLITPPDLTQPPDTSDPAVLLSTITFTLGPPVSPPTAEPAIATCDEPDDTGRPYVLHTRLIQELRILAQAGATEVTKAQELATLTSAVDPNKRLTLTAWFHLDHPVALTKPIKVQTRSGTSAMFNPTPPTGTSGPGPHFSNIWILTAPSNEFPVKDRDQVAVSFVPDSILVGNQATTLADRISQGLDLLDTQSTGEVVVYGTVDAPPTPTPPSPPPAVMQFVTVTVTSANSDITTLELWFHPQPQTEGPQVLVHQITTAQIEAFEESTGATEGLMSLKQLSNNVWSAQLRTMGTTGYLRLIFSVAQVTVAVVESPPLTLTLPAWMTKENITFEGWDTSSTTISTYVRVGLPQ
jgi:hypothetical protein